MRFWALLIAAALTPGLHAEWLKLTSPNFEFYTELPERQARETLEAFERARDFLFRVQPFKVSSPLPVTLVGFASTRAYAPYASDVTKAAYYAAGDQQDYIVMGYLAGNSSWVAVHEYVHLLVRHSGMSIPLWLNEGLADLYSTIQTRDGRIVVGASPQGRVQSLTRDQWLRLDEVVETDVNSKTYSSLAAAPMFYAESWLLAHMLMFSDNYSSHFPLFLEKLVDLGATDRAVAEVYGKSLAQVQGDMNLYFRRSFDGSPTSEAGPLRLEIAPARPATDLEIGLTLARIGGLIGRPEESEEQLKKLAAANPEHAGIDEARAYVALRANRRDAALVHFQAAMDHGAGNWKTYWDYARLSQGVPGTEEARLAALRKALEANPSLEEARLMIAQIEARRAGRPVLTPAEEEEVPERPVLRRGKQR